MTDRLIYAALVAVWMAYLVPMGFRRYRQVAGRGTMESFSASMLALGGAGGSTRSRTHGTRAGSPVAARPATPRPVTSPLDRPAARAAATRRRRTLLALLALTALTVVLVVGTTLLWPAVLVPLAVIVGFLVVCRTQVSRAEDAAWARAASRQAAPARAARPAVRAEVARSEPMGDDPDDEDTVVLAADDAAELAAMVASVPVAAAPAGAHPAAVDDPASAADGTPALVPAASGSHPAPTTWDPRPFTLPTYVTKPRATRTVRRVAAPAPDTRTSGRVDGESTGFQDVPEPSPQPRRAVGG